VLLYLELCGDIQKRRCQLQILLDSCALIMVETGLFLFESKRSESRIVTSLRRHVQFGCVVLPFRQQASFANIC
jgi:hypothetical protein